MTKFARIGANVEAFGHPTECTEPAPGTVVSTQSHNVTVTDSGGTTKELATVASAEMDIPTHAHTYDGSCVDDQSHSIDPRAGDDSSSVTINGSPLYLVKDNVQDDPGSGGQVDIIDAGGNNSVSES